jgi:hypothetical protein
MAHARRAMTVLELLIAPARTTGVAADFHVVPPFR